MPTDFFANRVMVVFQRYGMSYAARCRQSACRIALVGTIRGLYHRLCSRRIVQTIPVEAKDNPIKKVF